MLYEVITGPDDDAAVRLRLHQLADAQAVDLAHHEVEVLHPLRALGRITSYNVCYTKLLRAIPGSLIPIWTPKSLCYLCNFELVPSVAPKKAKCP